MSEPPNSQTRLTLLGKLREVPGDPAAWTEFVDWYSQKIYVWCRAWGLQEADAKDVTQDVFLKLSGRMKDFQYDPRGSFRAWLKTVTHHAWHDFLAKKQRPGEGVGGEMDWDRFSAVEAQEDFDRSLDAAAEQELLKEASARVRLRVEPRTWQAFEMLAIEGRTGADTAKTLGMKVATVFVARSKVQRMLREEVARLDPP